MIKQGYEYARIMSRDIFKPSFFIIGIFISLITLITAAVFFGMFYTFQITSLITGCTIVSILEWKDRRTLDTCYFTKVRHGRKRRDKVMFIFIEESMGWIFYVSLMMVMMVIFVFICNHTDISGSIMFPDDDAIFLSIKRFDFIELFYIFSMQYFFMSGLCALVTRFVKSARAYYLIMIIIVFVMLLFSSTLNAPFRAPIVNEDNSSYMGVREGKYWAGAYHDTAFEFLVLLNPQTHLNYLLGYEIYRMQYWIHPELGHVFKVSDEYLRNFFFYDKTSQFAFTLWYPLVFGIAIKLLELRTIY